MKRTLVEGLTAMSYWSATSRGGVVQVCTDSR